MTMELKGEKFCGFLENIVKCPVCQERLSGDFSLCEAGHCVCRECTLKTSEKCIVNSCKKPYTAIRNLLIQKLLQQIDGIKVCLMELDATNRKLNNDNETNNKKNTKLPGQCSCWIMDSCKFVGYDMKMVQHYKNHHPLEFHEGSDGKLPYTQNWQMNYTESDNSNRAFKIPKVGLFILHFSKNSSDILRACVLMHAPSGVAFQHYYRLEIKCDEKKKCYCGRVESARISKVIVSRHKGIGFFITFNEDLSNALREKSQFECSVTIEKINQTIFNGMNSKSENNQQNSAENELEIKDNDFKTEEFRGQQLNIDTKIKDEQKIKVVKEVGLSTHPIMNKTAMQPVMTSSSYSAAENHLNEYRRATPADFRKIKVEKLAATQPKSAAIQSKSIAAQPRSAVATPQSLYPLKKQDLILQRKATPADFRKIKVEKLAATQPKSAAIQSKSIAAQPRSAVATPKSLYPSLKKQDLIHQRNPNVFQTSGIVNNHIQAGYNNPTPSAPVIERQPPYNPSFCQQREANRERFNGAGKTNKNKNNGCVVS